MLATFFLEMQQPASPPQITEAEWIVMRVFWQKSSATAGDIVDSLANESDWKPRTIQSLIRRLHQKGILTAEKRGREFHYFPTITAKEGEHAAGQSFLGRFFDGQLAPFLATFVERENLSPQEITELKQILENNREADPEC